MTPTGLCYALPTSTQIVQWKTRHCKTETTLRYDHVSNDMVREYFLRNSENNNKVIVRNEDQMLYL